jgi:hypothetical protein
MMGSNDAAIRIDSMSVVGNSELGRAALVYIGGALAAIVTRLTAEERDGILPPNTWFHEFGFGAYAAQPVGRMFEDLDEVRDWAQLLGSATRATTSLSSPAG